uniref:Uncharacterized protein n=1 Tax=Mycena chlorophos TaxID=658473 RepID=A0ABQ0L7W3_MYCCL|nr:predicted protein [Mycena chlorophos]
MFLWGFLVLFLWRYRLPDTTRSFLSYTIHLTLILDRIFHSAATARPLHPLTEDDIRRVLDEYQGSEAAAQVDCEVQLFVDDTCDSAWKMYRGLGKPRAEELLRELVRQWRVGEDGAR